MAITTVLFDLDGTLLPMDQELFTKIYFKNLAARLAPLGYEPEKLIDTIWKGTYAMYTNTGETTNEEAFWKVFLSIYGEEAKKDEPEFEKFYQNEFVKAKDGCGFNPKAGKLVKELKEKGYKVALATNPLFPEIATYQRIQWAGLDADDFELITTYENSNYCKPNIDYFKDFLSRIDEKPENCLMVGNDAYEDMVAQKLGMKVFLLTHSLINDKDIDISIYPNGDFDDLRDYIMTL
ncbi:MAG: HAD family hydrolase [Bacillota bacterium]|jgi:FMN phosphatase YigB (HAD superfamily)|nr:HAD family hydrolase [Bacillota bacterium]NLL26347.1 HAD family hydrolase [Erysipelotrichia bacterium]